MSTETMLKAKVGRTRIEDEDEDDAGAEEEDEWQICETSVYFRYGGMAAGRHSSRPLTLTSPIRWQRETLAARQAQRQA